MKHEKREKHEFNFRLTYKEIKIKDSCVARSIWSIWNVYTLGYYNSKTQELEEALHDPCYSYEYNKILKIKQTAPWKLTGSNALDIYRSTNAKYLGLFTPFDLQETWTPTKSCSYGYHYLKYRFPWDRRIDNE